MLHLGLDLLRQMKPPRVIKTHLPIQLVPKGFWENKCKVIIQLKQLFKKNHLEFFFFFDSFQTQDQIWVFTSPPQYRRYKIMTSL